MNFARKSAAPLTSSVLAWPTSCAAARSRFAASAGYASKLEKDKPSLTGLFLHVELVQPRRSVPGGGKGNDGLAPDPGFTPAQYDRLALLYFAASVRKGTWLIPAFHAVLDTGFANGHDDPQNFSLADWSASLSRLQAVLQQADTGQQGVSQPAD